MKLQPPAGPPFPPAGNRPRLRGDLLSDVASHLLALRPGHRLLVAVDGVDGAGKTTFADDLATVLRDGSGPSAALPASRRPVLRVGLDDFHHVRAVRYRRGRRSPDGFWLDSYNLEQFKDYVLAPLASGAGTYRSRGHDLLTDDVLDPAPVPAPEDAVVLIDGMFLHRKELKDFWDFSLFLDVPFAVTAQRMAARDGTGAGSRNRQRYVGGQLRYFAAADPAAAADLVLDNSSPHTLRILPSAQAGYRTAERG
ncbi:uridine kinase [Arthrobacter yangruifuii]|uniref:uridine kinase n=1 Tax=Arthrobacter yangruifuii TaxID=2606616 RepID=UPI001FEF60BD|nr:uridine kinase [Arthrobacter yangruifuii]